MTKKQIFPFCLSCYTCDCEFVLAQVGSRAEDMIECRQHLYSDRITAMVLLVEVFQVQREALFHKSERQVAESQLATVQQQLSELQTQSSHIQELHKDVQESQGLVKEKDHKVRCCKDTFNICCWSCEGTNLRVYVCR